MYPTTMAKPAILLSLLEILTCILQTALSKLLKIRELFVSEAVNASLKSHLLGSWSPQLDSISQPPLQLGVATWWGAGQWDLAGCAISHFQARALKEQVYSLQTLHPPINPGGWWGHENERPLNLWREDKCPLARNAHLGLLTEQETYPMMSSNWKSGDICYTAAQSTLIQQCNQEG